MLDLDGVLADFAYSFMLLARGLGLSRVGVPVGANGQTKWGFDFKVDAVWEMVQTIPNWWMTLPPLVDKTEVEMINEVMVKHQVVFMTARKDGCEGYPVAKQTELWLKSIGIGTWGSYHLHTHVIATMDDKGPACVRHRVTHALDDKPSNLESLLSAGIPHVYCRDWQYNLDWSHPDVRRTGSVRAFLSEVLSA